MVFTVVIILLLAAIVFFHYLQGFFSSVLSAVLTVVAAVLAFSWHEVIVEKYLQGRMADYAHAMTLIVLFAVIYVVLRVAFDKMIPGAVQLPAAADKLGGALMGLVAGIFATGVFAVAAQELPFGPTVGMYSRFEVTDSSAIVSRNNRQNQDATLNDVLISEDAGRFNPVGRKMLYPPVDDMYLAAVRRLSETGSLQGDQPLSDVHPDFLTEAYGQRLGIQPGGGHVTMEKGTGEPNVAVEGVYLMGRVRLADMEPHGIRATLPKSGLAVVDTISTPVPALPGSNKTPDPKKTFIAAAGKDQENSKDQMLIVVRVLFGKDASDREDWMVRFSTGSIRLVARKFDPVAGEKKPADYFPLGTVEKSQDGMTLYLNKPDDFLFVSAKEKQACVDLAFAVDRDGFLGGDKEQKIVDGTFLEVKRMARLDLGGKSVATWVAPPMDRDSQGNVTSRFAVGAMHKESDEFPNQPQAAAQPAPPRPPVQPVAPPQPNPANPAAGQGASKLLDVTALKQSNLLPVSVGMPNSEVQKPLINIPGAIEEATLKEKKYQHLKVDPQMAAEKLGTGDFKTRELYVPDGQILVQVLSGTPADAWAWAKKSPDIKMVDSAGAAHAPAGIWAIVSDGEDKLFARYDGSVEYPLAADLVNPVPTQGKPSQIVIAYLIPVNTTPKELTADGQQIKDLSKLPLTKLQ
ncbi:MAG TPA: CvpA family protein [Tepidisphaeraceae bacterium]|jgi:hypothetical protein|nr:CvpA family protein [Tepidisphaeraceae bacterium]